MRKRINSGQSSPSIDDKHHLPQHHSEEEEYAHLLVELTPHRRLVAQHPHPSDVDLEHPSAAYQGVDNEQFGSTDNPKYHHHHHVRSLKAVATNAIHSMFRIWASCSTTSNAFICPRILLSGSTTTSSTTTGATDVIFNGKAYRRKRSLLRSILLFSLLFLPFFFTLTLIIGNLTRKNGIVHYETTGKSSFRKQTTKRIILSPQDLAMSQYRTQTQPYKSQSTSFAVVINTFRRPDMLKLSLDHWVNTCGRNDVHSIIAKVYVVWAEVDKIPPRPEDVLPPPKDGSSVGGPEVQFLRVPKDSLNSRFLPIDELIQTSSENSSSSSSSSSSTLSSTVEAVFMVDDDVRVDCESMWEGFEAWRHHPSSLVGFYPRLASPSLKHPWFGQPSSPSKTQTRMVYHTWPVVYGRQKFNIILTKASFFHKMYLEMYHDDKENPREVLDYVDQHKNCEDIAMAFLVARHAKSKRTQQTQHNQEEPFYCVDCPVYIHGKIQDLGLFNGISTSGGSLAPSGHMEKRSMCLDALTDIYKEKRGWEYPLWDVSLSDQSWTHTFGWWLNAPSNVYEWFSFGNTFM